MYPGSFLTHCSLLFHVWGALSLKLAMEEPAPLEKRDYKGALRHRDAQHSKKGILLSLVLPKSTVPHATHMNSHFQIHQPRHKKRKSQTFSTWPALTTLAAIIHSQIICLFWLEQGCFILNFKKHTDMRNITYNIAYCRYSLLQKPVSLAEVCHC